MTGPSRAGWSNSCKRARAPARLRCATADHDHRGTVEQSGRQRGHRVGHARSGGDCGEPGRPVQPARGLSGEDGGRLVADVEQSHGSVALGGLPIGCGIEPLLAADRGVVQREDVGPREGEQGGRAVRPRRGEDVVPAVAGDLGFAHDCDASTAPGARACRGRPRRSLTARMRARLRSARRVPSRSLPGPALPAPPDRPAGTRTGGDGRAAGVGLVMTDLHVGDPGMVQEGLREGADHAGHQAPALGICAQPVSDLDAVLGIRAVRVRPRAAHHPAALEDPQHEVAPREAVTLPVTDHLGPFLVGHGLLGDPGQEGSQVLDVLLDRLRHRPDVGLPPRADLQPGHVDVVRQGAADRRPTRADSWLTAGRCRGAARRR